MASTTKRKPDTSKRPPRASRPAKAAKATAKKTARPAKAPARKPAKTSPRTARPATRTAARGAAKKPARNDAARGKARGGKPARSAAPVKKAAPARTAKAAPKRAAAAKAPARARRVSNGHPRAAAEKTRLSPRVKAALKAATWAADWVAAQGRFVWHDLLTTDAPAARAFYTELFGWGVEELDMGGVEVLLLKNGDRSIGTIMAEPSLPASHWMPYLAVNDVEATCKRLSELGGQVCVGATSVPSFGRFAVANDPQGGTFSPLKRLTDAGPPPDPGQPAPGDFCWDELSTSDPEAAARFYGELFGWSVESVPMEQPYWMAKNEGVPVAGIMGQPDALLRPSWLPYLAVADVDATAAQAAGLGATVLVPASDIPGLGRFAVLVDPTGARFALYFAQPA
jgi:uncharacterized protein